MDVTVLRASNAVHRRARRRPSKDEDVSSNHKSERGSERHLVDGRCGSGARVPATCLARLFRSQKRTEELRRTNWTLFARATSPYSGASVHCQSSQKFLNRSGESSV